MQQQQVIPPPDSNSYHLEMKDSSGAWRPFYVNGQPMFPVVQPIDGRLYGVESLSLVQIVAKAKTVRSEYPGREVRFRQNILSQRVAALTERANRQ